MNAPSHTLPIPGLVWGRYPQRRSTDTPRRIGITTSRPGDARRLRAVRTLQAEWQALDTDTFAARLARLRARLARDGWSGEVLIDALGCVADAGARSLGRSPFDTQLQAATVLLADQFAEMATGEGKTYAAALAAAVAALAGVPVHVMTANDYLVQRDAQQLQAFYAQLGLSVGAVTGPSSADERRAAYACDICYATAREVAFDYLRDGLAAVAPGDELKQRALSLAGTQTSPPLLRGLCMAVLDEADSLLIDDAGMPLILAEAHDDAQQRAACFQALALARELQLGRDVQLAVAAAGSPHIVWLEAGEQRLDALCADLGGAWHNRRHRHNLVASALEALHVLQRDRHYMVRDGSIQLLDAQTGRVGAGRVWSNGLQTLVELKEGCKPSTSTTTRAQISFQGFFTRYLRLCGMSGTLAECRRELASVYRRRVAVIPLRRASRRVLGPERLFLDAVQRRRAVVQRVGELHASGQPVLVGTDSVAESEALSMQLTAAGIAHRVLNARHDDAEAEIVARSGLRGAVTVATQMAGRGTDITLGEGVAELGGLHVLCCQDGVNRRLERQLIGRCARQGDPGSAETWRQLQAPRLAASRVSSVLSLCRQHDERGSVAVPAGLLRSWAVWAGGVDERSRARQRRRHFEQDRQW